mgnify:CR=1 FL=1
MERHASAPTTTMTSGVVVTLLALLLGLQAVASDLYLPGLPQLTQELGADMRGAQYTLSGMLLAFGLSQLIWGPLSDRFGRRPVLLAGRLVDVSLIAFSFLMSVVGTNPVEPVIPGPARC